MQDDTLVAQIKEVGSHYGRLVEEAEKRGYRVHMETQYIHSSDPAYVPVQKYSVVILKRV